MTLQRQGELRKHIISQVNMKNGSSFFFFSLSGFYLNLVEFLNYCCCFFQFVSAVQCISLWLSQLSKQVSLLKCGHFSNTFSRAIYSDRL